ncbi:hypothetical protein K9L05_02820 [Candidatus Babeliales bacterium]|nr:hypothetical protein [Candidatus Babeliales bacterium]MCF7899558.1 hypothetical protein [Candidatus Babeliales bacterium]
MNFFKINLCSISFCFLFVFFINNIFSQDPSNKKALDLITNAKIEALKIKSQAEQYALKIKTEAELAALKAEHNLPTEPNLFMKEPDSKQENGEQIPQEWKYEIQNQFDQDSKFIKEIVVKGEVSQQEIDDFLDLFKSQSEWFDQTLTHTKNIGDSNYLAITKKNTILEKLVDAQKKADSILRENLSKEEFGESVYDKVRLAILYEINALIESEESSISEDRINKIVKNIVGHVKKQNELLSFKSEKVTQGSVKKLEHELKRFKKEAIDNKNLAIKMEGDVRSRLEEKNRKNLELEILLQKTQQILDKLKNQTKDILKNKDKDSVQFQIRLAQVKKEINFFKDQLSESKKNQIYLENKYKKKLGLLKEKLKNYEDQKLNLENALNKERLHIKEIELEIKQKEFEKKQILKNKIKDQKSINRLNFELELALKEKRKELDSLKDSMKEYENQKNILNSKLNTQKNKIKQLEQKVADTRKEAGKIELEDKKTINKLKLLKWRK